MLSRGDASFVAAHKGKRFIFCKSQSSSTGMMNSMRNATENQYIFGKKAQVKDVRSSRKRGLSEILPLELTELAECIVIF